MNWAAEDKSDLELSVNHASCRLEVQTYLFIKRGKRSTIRLFRGLAPVHVEDLVVCSTHSEVVVGDGVDILAVPIPTILDTSRADG